MQIVRDQVRSWVVDNYTNAEHLLRTVDWLLRLDVYASEASILAALTHDMERAFPGVDSPQMNMAIGAVDVEYNRAHAERSARIVSKFLRQCGTAETLLEEVASLIRAHETGGWPAANLVQAADSLSFLEVNVDSFLHFLSMPRSRWTGEFVCAKFDWMYYRIQVPEASALALPLYQTAIQKVSELVTIQSRSSISYSGNTQ